jgi:hypothetical protein
MQEVIAEMANSLPQTPWEAFMRWRAFAVQAEQQMPSSPLHAPVPVHFFVTLPGRRGWYNHLTQDHGLYGKVLPPFRLQDGRSIVPIVGDIYEVESIEQELVDPSLAAVRRQLLDGLDEIGPLGLFDDEVRTYVGERTLKSLLWILREKHDGKLAAFLVERGVSFEDLIGLPWAELVRCVPSALFYHADQLHWGEYWASHQSMCATHPGFRELARKRWCEYRWTWNGRGFARWAVPWFQAYQQLGDYLAIEFLEKRDPRPYRTWVLSDAVRERILQHVRLRVTIRHMTAADLRERFGLAQICDPAGRPATLHAWTFRDLVGRLAFLYHGAFVEARSPWRGLRPIDRPEDLLEAVRAGECLTLTAGRLDFKGIGTIQPKLSILKTRNSRIVVRDGVCQIDHPNASYVPGWPTSLLRVVREVTQAPVDVQAVLYLKESEQEVAVSLPELLQKPGMILNTEYQPGFPSPSGTEVTCFSAEGMRAEGRLQAVGGESPYHTLARFSFGEQSAGCEVAGSLRITRHGPERSLRIAEALQEFRVDPAQSQCGRWRAEGVLMDRLERLFEGLGRNQAALLLSGKLWIRLGAKLLHNIDGGRIQAMGATYRFFQYNTDIVEGRPADLGDYLRLDHSLNDNDVRESVAVLVAMVGQLLRDLEAAGLVPPSVEARRHLLARFHRGFTGRTTDPARLPDALCLDQVRYERIALPDPVYPDRTYTSHRRNALPEDTEAWICELHASIAFMERHWPIRAYFYDTVQEATAIRRFSPFDALRDIGPLQSLHAERAGDYCQLVLRQRSGGATPAPADDATGDLAFLASMQGQVPASALASRLRQGASELSTLSAAGQALLELVAAVHEALRTQSATVQEAGQVMPLGEALERINRLRQALTARPGAAGDEQS